MHGSLLLILLVQIALILALSRVMGWLFARAHQPQVVGEMVAGIMLGPSLYIRFTPKMFMTAAWNTQVWGREVGNPVSLNLAEFQRNRARLKFAREF